MDFNHLELRHAWRTSHKKIASLSGGIGVLEREYILTQKSFDYLSSLESQITNTACIWSAFLEVGLLNQDVWEAVKTQRLVKGLISSDINEMTQQGLITAEQKEAFMWQGPIELNKLNTSIHELFIHGSSIVMERSCDSGVEKGQDVITLALEIKLEVKLFWEQSLTTRKQTFVNFEQGIVVKLNEHEPKLSLHRTKWFTIKANIITFLTGIGILLMGLNYALTGRFCLFKTASEHKAKHITKQLYLLKNSDSKEALISTTETPLLDPLHSAVGPTYV